MRRYTIDLDAPAGGAQPMAPAEPAPAVVLPPVAEKAPPNNDGSNGRTDARAVPGESARPANGASATPTPTPAANVTPPAAPAPTVATPMASAPQAVTTNPNSAPSPARAETPKPAPSAGAAQRGGFAVQLGSFVSKENAERLVHEMSSKGFNAFVAPPIMTGGRELYRVRVGPTRDRASAEALAAQLRRMGQSGSIVPIP
jgi:DedD protein